MNHVNIIGRLTTTPRKIEDNKRELHIQTIQISRDKYDAPIEHRTTHRVVVWGRYVKVVDAFGDHLYDVAIEGHLENGVVIVNDLITL